MPTMLEQIGNAVRMITVGFGLRVDFLNFKARNIVNAVTEVTTNKKYIDYIHEWNNYTL